MGGIWVLCRPVRVVCLSRLLLRAVALVSPCSFPTSDVPCSLSRVCSAEDPLIFWVQLPFGAVLA